MVNSEPQIPSWGRIAEELAAEYMLKQGYTLREKNWRPSGSRGNRLEIDLVCQQGTTIVFVEVKARAPESGDPVDSVDNPKIKRIVQAADSYLRMQEHDYSFRFDIISIVGTCREDATIEHIQDAFIPPLHTY